MGNATNILDRPVTGKPGGASVQFETKDEPGDAAALRTALGVAGESVEREGRGSARRGPLDLTTSGLVAA